MVSVHFCLKSDHKVFTGIEVSWELGKLLENSSRFFFHGDFVSSFP